MKLKCHIFVLQQARTLTSSKKNTSKFPDIQRETTQRASTFTAIGETFYFLEIYSQRIIQIGMYEL